MKNTHYIAIAAIAILALGGIGALLIYGRVPQKTATAPTIVGGTDTAGAPALTQAYENKALGFSLYMPADYTATEIPPDPSTGSGQASATTILLQNSSGDGVQVVITPHQDVTTITADMIKADIPDMKIDDVQEVDIGPTYKGVAFTSDNEAFGGDSREVWFVFHGNLYQISTYARLDSLLRSMFVTWNFTR